MNNVELNIVGLKCDNCDWIDMSIPFSEYENNINRPCPKCGQSILTQEDYEECLAMVKAAEIINNIPEQNLPKIEELSQEQIDMGLDFINKHGLKKIEENPDGTETWSSK